MRDRVVIVDILTKKFKSVFYKQYDDNNELNIVVYEGKTLANLSNYVASVYFELPSGKVYEIEGTIENNTIKVMLSSSILEECGQVNVECELSNLDKIVTTFTFYLNVEKSINKVGALDPNMQHKHSNLDVLNQITQEMVDSMGLNSGLVDLSIYQTKEDTTLETDDKTVSGAINELNEKVGNGMNDEQIQQLNTAYTHSQTTHVQQSDMPTKISQLENDSDFATNASVDEKIANVSTGGTVPVTQVEPLDDDIPKVFFNGDKPTSKTSVYATIEYISKTKHFKGYVDIKCQGTSSMSYPKKNYTIKIFTDETMVTKLKQDFKGWGKQNKFCLKANYIDHSHARNICSAKLWNEIVASRTNYEALPELLRTSPKNGAIDGFPIKVYYNNTYEGLYTWNIPKDKWMFNMDDSLDNHCVLCGEEYVSGCFRAANASAWSDEIHDVMPQSIVTSFNNFITFVMNSSDEEFRANLENYVYVDSLIDYYIFQYVICGLDSMGKNQLFGTYDGTKWIATSYDMDSTFGLYWNGQSFVSPQYRMQEDYESMTSGRAGNLLYFRLEQLFPNEIRARYDELRNSVLSYTNVVNTFERFMDIPDKDLYAEDTTIYTGIPSQATNNIQQIRNYYRDRLTYVDGKIAGLRVPVPCTSISLDTNTLSLTNDNKTATLVATVTPSETTDTIVWSVSPSGICTVNNGLVTAKANGDCTITVTCGQQSATCNVNVSGMTERVFNKVFSIDSTCLNTEANTLIDKVSGISATITGAPTISDNKIVFTEADTFNANITSLGLTDTTARTLRVKFTPTSLSASLGNITIIGNTAADFNSSDSMYVSNTQLRIQWGFAKNITDKTVGYTADANNRLPGNPELNHEYEIILSQNSDGTLRYWIDGVLVQDGKMSPRNNWNYLSNDEGSRFIGSYSLIELYAQYFDEYPFGEQSLPEGVLFELSEPIIGDGTESTPFIDTNIQLMSEENINNNWTILVECMGNTAGQNTVVHCMWEQPDYPGVSIDYTLNNLRVVAPNNRPTNVIPNALGTRINIALVKNGNTFTIYDKLGNVKNTEEVIPTVHNSTLVIGAYKTTDGQYGRYLNGEIYKFRVSSEAYTTNQIIEYFNSNESDLPLNELVYELNTPQVLDGSSKYIDTHIPLCKSNMDYTIFMNFKMNAGSAAQQAILHCMTEQNPYPGISLQVAGSAIQASGANIVTTLANVNNDASSRYLLSSQSIEYQPFVLRKQGNTIELISKVGKASSVYTHNPTINSLLLGAYRSSNGALGRYANITINQAKVWTKAITDEEIQSLING